MPPLPNITPEDFESPRERELMARTLLARQDVLPEMVSEKRWRELFCLAEFVQDDVPSELIATDPALYRTLRAQVTELRLAGFGHLSTTTLGPLIAG